jgi:pseudouridine-5'-phosphate glycosidase
MTPHAAHSYIVADDIQQALNQGDAVVALESTVITHGLPHPQNLNLARDLETIVRSKRAVPATIAILDGYVRVGLKDGQLDRLSREKDIRKISVRDIAAAIVQGASGGTTVAGTLAVAAQLGISVFATGGIGGVHRGNANDVSADLPQLAASPVLVVCAGAKSILDLPATVEYLETLGVPVLGYQTDEFPAFFSRQSGLGVSATVFSPEEAGRIALEHWSMSGGGILVVVPPPEEQAIQEGDMKKIIEEALAEAEKAKVSGQAVTPFLLDKVHQLSAGRSLAANLALLKNNAAIASEIAQAMI